MAVLSNTPTRTTPVICCSIDGRGAFKAALGELASFLAFVEALSWAGSTLPCPLPDAVVITRAIHASVETDKVKNNSAARSFVFY